jgi:hypothetical protein
MAKSRTCNFYIGNGMIKDFKVVRKNKYILYIVIFTL